MNLYLSLYLISDTCFAGSGGGRVGTVDTDLETDPANGLPIVRGRTLKGLLVEELAQLLRVLEPTAKGPWHRAAAGLFGTPSQSRGGCLAFHDGELPASLRAAVAQRRWHRTEVLEALTTVRSQTMIDAETGAPRPHSLRSARLLRAGLSLRARLSCETDLDQARRALLAACTAAVRRAGLHRNHGWGEVRLRLLDGNDRDLTADWLTGLRNAVQPDTKRLAPSGEMPSRNGPPAAETGRRVLSCRLRLTAPAVLAVAGADAGSVETLPYISGATVLGALAWRWLDRYSPGDDPAADPDFRRLFLDGSVRFLNAYVTGSDGSRLLPCPISLVRRKGETHTLFDRASPDFEGLRGDEPDTQWQSPQTPFVRLHEALPELGDEDDELSPDESDEAAYTLFWRTPGAHPRLHNTRDDREAGRSTDGALFSYVSLDAGECLSGCVLFDRAADAEVIRSLIASGPLPLGRSRTAGYGGWAEVELEVAGSETWCEVSPRRWRSDAETGRVVVTLLSDYLGINSRGLPDPSALETDVRDALGIEGPSVARFLGRRLVAGRLSHWHMRRPTCPAVTAGSVLVFEAARLDSARVAELGWLGIGQRRAEGFGRVAVNWHGAARLAVSPDSPPGSPPALSADTGDESGGLALLERNLLRNALHRTLADLGDREARRVGRPPSPALIGRLRARIRTASAAADVQAFLQQAMYRPADKGLKRAGQALEGARVEAEPLAAWLEQRLTGTVDDPTPAWTRHEDVRDACSRLGLGLDLIDEDDRWRLLQTYLDAFCERLRRYAQSRQSATAPGGLAR